MLTTPMPHFAAKILFDFKIKLNKTILSFLILHNVIFVTVFFNVVLIL